MNYADGRYMGRLITATLTEGAKKKPVLELVWELLDDHCRGQEVISKHYFTGGAETITVDMMRSLGWDESEELLSMLGRECALTAKTDPEYGQQWRPMAFAARPMDKSKARSFLAGLSTKTTTSPFAGRQTEDEDGIPF